MQYVFALFKAGSRMCIGSWSHIQSQREYIYAAWAGGMARSGKDGINVGKVYFEWGMVSRGGGSGPRGGCKISCNNTG